MFKDFGNTNHPSTSASFLFQSNGVRGQALPEFPLPPPSGRSQPHQDLEPREKAACPPSPHQAFLLAPEPGPLAPPSSRLASSRAAPSQRSPAPKAVCPPVIFQEYSQILRAHCFGIRVTPGASVLIFPKQRGYGASTGSSRVQEARLLTWAVGTDRLGR